MGVRKTRWVGALASVALLAAACGGGATGSNATTEPETPAADETQAEGAVSGDPISIGLIAATSGVVGGVGSAMQQGAELAVEEINADGGVDGRPLELIVRDTKADPNEAIAAVRELSGDGVNLFTGVVSSGVALALPQVLESSDAVVITAAAGSDEITAKENFSENLFRISDNTYMRMNASAKFFRDKFPDIHRWANLSPDYAYGQSAWTAFDNAMKELDPEYEVVADEWPAFGASDFKNHISAVVNAEPQALFSALYSSDAITMSKQAAAYELFDTLELSFNTSNEGDISDGLGQQMHTEWGAVHYNPAAFDNDLSRAFAESFEEKFGSEPHGYHSEAYTAIYAYKQAIEEAGGTDTQAIIESLEGMKFDSVTGERHFRPEDHQAIKDIGFVLFEPDPDSERGWKITDTAVVSGEEVAPPLE